MSNITALSEAWGDIVDRSEPFFDDISNGYQRSQYASRRYDRLDGRFLPVYDNELDLAVIRSMGRLMHERVPMAKAKTRRLVDYTISRGFDWSIKHQSPELAAKLNEVCERFVSDNRWTVEGERDSFEAECVDGEFLADLRVDSGELAMNLLTADNLVEPADPRALEEWKRLEYPCSWLFGVATKHGQPHRPKYYHILRDDGGTDWDLIPRRRMIHWKRNVPLLAKRGYSDHYTTHVYLGRADKVLANTAEGAAVQAAIAYIVEHVQGTTGTQAQNTINNLLNVTGRDPVTGIPRRAKKIVPGQRVDVPAGMKYHAGLFGKSNNDIYVKVMESLIRLAGTIEAFPEHMLTGFAGNNNMASSLTAESPFIQGRLADQEVRKMRLIEMFKKVIRLAWELRLFRGWSWEDLMAGMEITVQPASIVNRDPAQLTTALSAQKDAGWISDRTASQELGLDYEAEQKNIASQPKPAQPPALPGGPPGAGGLPGVPGGDAPKGGLSSLSRMQWKRNKAAIEDILGDARSGKSTPAYAKAMLKSLGLSEEEALALMEDQSGNDPPDFKQVKEQIAEVIREVTSRDISVAHGRVLLTRLGLSRDEAWGLTESLGESKSRAVSLAARFGY